ncbi:hypothetical protein [Bacillus subtilis]|nr:hypothetical protein [Bacillus subtilis]GLI90554.1 hypothetical protein ANABIO4_39060 [Bacillus subtilis]
MTRIEINTIEGKIKEVMNKLAAGNLDEMQTMMLEWKLSMYKKQIGEVA